jgi:DNA-binding LacI/PurR family transcriptional regulator
MAFGALREIRDAGLRVPEDVAVIGFDDHPMSELMDLSTVRQPVVDQALDVTARLLALIAEDTEELPRDPAVVLPTELIARGTTGARS